MPDVNEYDDEGKWMAACVPKMIDEGRPQQQAVAACMSMWRQKGEADKATWDTAYMNNLPDSAFLFIDSTGTEKDADGRTVPRSARHFPYRNAEGAVDLPHLRNAIARIPQSNAPGLSAEKKQQLQDKARRLLEDASKSDKAGRRLRSDWAKKLKDLKDAFTSWLKDIGDMESWANYADEPAAKDAEPQGYLRTFKAKDGKTWLLTWTTNAFKDRDSELFTTKSIEDYVERHENDDVKGTFQLWHLPGTDFGTIRWQGVVGRFLVEAGPFDDTPIGAKFKSFYEAHPDGHPVHAPTGWATSHRYSYRDGDRDDGVYDWFDKEETSVLPFEAAANQHNPQPEVLSMNSKQEALLRDIVGDELVKTIIATGEAQTKALEEQGIAYKANEEPKPAEEKPAEPTVPLVDLKAVDELIAALKAHDEALRQTDQSVTALRTDMTSMREEIAALKKADAVKVAEATPRTAWYRGSQAAATVLDDTKPEDAALKAKKPVPGAIQAIAAKIGQ